MKRLRRSVANLESFLHGVVKNEREITLETLDEIWKNTMKIEKMDIPHDSQQYLLWEHQQKQASCK